MKADWSPRGWERALAPGLIALSLAACGGSGHAVSGGASASSHSGTPGAAGERGSAASPGPAGVGTAARQGEGGTDVRLPATFTVEPSGTLSPPSVSSPASVPIDLTIVSRDGHNHQVEVEASPARVLAVPANGRTSVLMTGLRPGRYVLRLDGSPRGALVVGVQPGP